MRKLAKQLGTLLFSLAISLAFGYGFYGLATYALPLSKGNYKQSRTSAVADETEVLLNGAAEAYEQGRPAEAVKVLELTIEKLIDRTGRYSLSDQYKLERAYFLLGKIYHKAEVYDKAIQAYEDTLRLNPNHLPAKYNLEMIQLSGGGGGAGGKQPDNSKTKPKI